MGQRGPRLANRANRNPSLSGASIVARRPLPVYIQSSKTWEARLIGAFEV
jgi:hypothetical protein